MYPKWRKIIQGILIIGLLCYAVFLLYKKGYVAQFEEQYFPCRSTIQYSIGQFDTQFGISKDDFLKAVQQAAQIWDEAARKTLYQYDPVGNSGDLKINLIYDYRQQNTQRLQQLGLTINDDQASYDKLKAQYNVLQSEYYTEKAAIDQTISAFDAKKQSYESQVQYWNSRGGAPAAEYSKLQAEKAQLDSEAAAIQSRQNSFNQLVDNLNAVGTTLNTLARELNAQVNNYNSVGASTGEEFQEGLYQSSAAGREVDVYQFDNYNQLVRLLAHELGHALGLQHISDPNAIMYAFNQSKTLTPTAADIAQLDQVCGIK